MLEIQTESLQFRRKPHRKYCRRRSTSICKQHGITGDRVIANTVSFLWILVTLISLLSFREDTLVCAGDDNYAAQADDANAKNDDAAAAANGDDAAAADSTDDAATETTDDNSSNSAYENEQNQYQDTDDDTFHWNQNIGFDGVSVMPLSCIN